MLQLLLGDYKDEEEVSDTILEVILEENPVNKNQGWEPIHQKYKANENTSRHNPKKKNKQSTKIR
jgi:hypothetical protein